MRGGELTDKEKEVIRELLWQEGIEKYEIIPDSPEGSIPEGPYPDDVSALSGYIVTRDNIYYFWLDWYDGHYTLGQEEGYWEKVTLAEIGNDAEIALALQQQLNTI